MVKFTNLLNNIYCKLNVNFYLLYKALFFTRIDICYISIYM